MHERSERQGEHASNGVSATLAKSVEPRLTEALVFSGGTLRDDSDGRLVIALARALDLATEKERIDIVERILAQIERLGRG